MEVLKLMAGVIAASRSMVVAVPLMASAACSDSTSPSGSQVELVSRAISSAKETPADAQAVARGIGLAMAAQDIRASVRDAMRASMVNEHKLVLQDFVQAPSGQRLLASAAAAVGSTLEDFRKNIAALPRLDFYAPFEIHRKTWRGTPDVMVAVTFDTHSPSAMAYKTNGDAAILRESDGVPSSPVLVLHPEEPKLKRNSPQVDVPGDVIQDENDGVDADRYTPGNPNIRLAALSNGAMPSLLGGNNVYINHFNIQEGDGFLGGDLEMEFHSYALSGNYVFNSGGTLIPDNTCPLGTYARDGVKEDKGYDGLQLLSPGVFDVSSVGCASTFPAWYAIHIVEVDGSVGSNDDYGWRFYRNGAYPNGAQVGTVESFYAETIHTGTRTAYLRIVYN